MPVNLLWDINNLLGVALFECLLVAPKNAELVLNTEEASASENIIEVESHDVSEEKKN